MTTCDECQQPIDGTTTVVEIIGRDGARCHVHGHCYAKHARHHHREEASARVPEGHIPPDLLDDGEGQVER